MQLSTLDWIIIGSYFLLILIIGLIVSRKAGKNTSEFFLSGRGMPWWLLGISMVATTFSTDTPNLVTDIVRQHGVSGNWVWWAILLTGMLTVFVYAKLWRRSGVLTDVEFYEIRYSGKSAAFLRGFRAIYLGFFFNVLVMTTVTLAAIKIGGVMLGLEPWVIVLIAGSITVIFSMVGGFRAVIFTDLILFCTAMFGAVAAAYYALGHPDVGGLSGMLANETIQGKLSILPDFDKPDVFVPLLVIPLAVQWWSVWYPGGEPGGGGYIAQRMLAAKNEKHAIGATLFFNCAHYALRPWPWIIVALCSLAVFPNLASIQEAFPNINPAIVKDDLAYPAMLTFLPAGILGLVIASLAAAYMSTISTQLNLGSSYLVNDFWKRFIKPEASERQLVLVGRIFTLLLMVVSSVVALYAENALQMFNLMMQIGAGTGLIFLLRWFWWRINAYSELSAMVVSFLVAAFFFILDSYNGAIPKEEALIIPVWLQLTLGVAITTFAWLLATALTEPTDKKTLRSFYKLITPGGPGWTKVVEEAKADGEILDERGEAWDVPLGLLAMFFGCVAVYGALFATGYWLYGMTLTASILSVVAAVSMYLMFTTWKKMAPTREAEE